MPSSDCFCRLLPISWFRWLTVAGAAGLLLTQWAIVSAQRTEVNAPTSAPPAPTLDAPAGSPEASERAPVELRRRAFLGTQLAPVTDETRKRQGLANGKGTEILKVFPNSTASAAKLREGDVIVGFGEFEIDSTAALLRRLAARQGGDEVQVEFFRDGKKQTRTLNLIEMPRESSDAYEVELGAVESTGGKLRTYVTRPKTEADQPPVRRPALMILPGIGQFTMEHLPGGDVAYHALIDDFARRGYVTLRVDKPGCGDSLGGPLADVDFETQLDGFRQGLQWLREQPDVDPERILLFGHSMGGVWAPLLAAEIPVRGIAVYGTIARTWIEYLLENNRRQFELAGVSAGDVDRQLMLEAQGLAFVYGEKLSPEETAAKNEHLAAWVESTFQEGKYFSGCHYKFFQQLADRALGEAWADFPGQVLSLWGEADFIAGSADHALIAEIVNRSHPGRAEYRILKGIDHNFNTAATPVESRSRFGQPGGRFNPQIVETLRAWSESLER